ncbi:hypothetical protein O1M54_03780 [Streptomyces diastatochromogenes]|nr:hypothetical protein [Streptomyces diastatochromogenes]
MALGAPVFTYHVSDDGPPLAPGTELFHLDSDPGQAAWLPTGTSILTTLRPALTRLTELLKEADRDPPPPALRPGRPRRAAHHPELFFDLLSARLPRDRVLVEEAPVTATPSTRAYPSA